jgi:membrane protein DedA with SNARE-associated domain
MVLDWISELIATMGYEGVALLMLLENVVPPIPSELIMPLAGYVASQGQLSTIGVIAAGTTGSFIGAVLWFWVARRYGSARLRSFVDRHGKWVTLDCEDIDKANNWFRRHGRSSVFIGRLIPGVRTLISVPAGLSDMSAPLFLIYTLAGSILWNAVLVWAGHLLQANYQAVKGITGPVSTGVFSLMAAALVWRYVQQWRKRQQKA